MRPVLKLSYYHKKLLHRIDLSSVRLGIEFTTIPPFWQENDDDVVGYPPEWEDFRDRVQTGLRCPYQNADSDPGCLEISSQIMYSWREVIRFYRGCRGVTDRLGCVVKTPDSTGGGGHIHISFSNDEDSVNYERLAFKLHNFITHHPWIAWALNDSSDNINAMVARPYELRWAWSEERGDFRTRRAVHDCNHKDYAVLNDDDNIEFRFFDAATSLNMQVEHVAFATRLLHHGLTLPDIESNAIPRRAPRITLRQALAGWRRDVCMLGLPLHLYRHYERNIRERFELGRAYLN